MLEVQLRGIHPGHDHQIERGKEHQLLDIVVLGIRAVVGDEAVWEANKLFIGTGACSLLALTARSLPAMSQLSFSFWELYTHAGRRYRIDERQAHDLTLSG